MWIYCWKINRNAIFKFNKSFYIYTNIVVKNFIFYLQFEKSYIVPIMCKHFSSRLSYLDDIPSIYPILFIDKDETYFTKQSKVLWLTFTIQYLKCNNAVNNNFTSLLQTQLLYTFVFFLILFEKIFLHFFFLLLSKYRT